VLLDLFPRYIDLSEESVTIADVGAAGSTHRFFEGFPNVEYLVVDRYRSADVTSDITNISLESDSVDGILCCHVLEHVDDYRKGMRELFRILKPGHHGLVAVPQTPGLEKSRRISDDSIGGYGHLWEFGDDFAEMLKAAGFQVTTVNVPVAERSEQRATMPYHVVHKPCEKTAHSNSKPTPA